MSHDEFVHALYVFTRRRPFKSFKVELISGDRFAVVHPEAIRPSKKLFLHVSPDFTKRLFDATAVSHFLDEPRPNP